MDKNEIKDWSRKYVEGKLGEREKAVFEAWYLESGEEVVIPPDEVIAKLRAEVFQNLPANRGGKFSGGFLMAAAAVAVVAVSLILQVVFHQSDRIAGNNRRDIPPGGNRAVLTLAGGEQINLTKASTGKLTSQGNTGIVKNASGQVIYQEEGHQKGDQAFGQNSISTPVGGIWQICLPDGTRVWLNNSSSLSYPTSFEGKKERRVNLTGEAYFEVARDKHHPFVVYSGDQEVRVLGTHFNVRAFRDDPLWLTTLVVGRVTVRSKMEGEARDIKPGEQALNDNGHFLIRPVNTADAVAWKDGYFRFTNTPVEQVMRELSRWYGVEVRFEGPVPDEHLNGKISRSRYISKVLAALEATQIVHFKVEGRRVIVRK
ncbi:FecR domain-containing protein [Mucilaginibacter sp. CAU 1740]|uniref:FecR family protein n=1 Tax=Mucilaginibacter sp. CAU 1740 TaxID=3140365 RepID=UPI00325B8AAB